MEKEIKIEIGGQSVIIDKLFGPQIFANLRITPDTSTNTWIIEREVMMNDSKGRPVKDHPDCIQIGWHEWVEWIRIPGQLKCEFRQNRE